MTALLGRDNQRDRARLEARFVSGGRGVCEGLRKRMSLSGWCGQTSDKRFRFRRLGLGWKRIAPTETKRAQARPGGAAVAPGAPS